MTTDLFTHAEQYPQGPGHRRRESQIEAAKKVAPRTATMRDLIEAHVGNSTGLTRQEIADQLGLKLQTVCGRVAELIFANRLKESGATRDGRNVLVNA